MEQLVGLECQVVFSREMADLCQGWGERSAHVLGIENGFVLLKSTYWYRPQWVSLSHIITIKLPDELAQGTP